MKRLLFFKDKMCNIPLPPPVGQERPCAFPTLYREPAMTDQKTTAINPGNVILGKISQSIDDGTRYKIIFCCRKSGLDYLGQIQIAVDEAKLKVEMFNEGFFERFEAEREDVQTVLQRKALTVLLRSANLPDRCRSMVRSFINEIRAPHAAKDSDKESAKEPAKDDLAAIYENLNRQYFNGTLNAEIQWGRDSKTPNRRSFSFGSYDPKKKLIRIHPRLRQEFVPFVVLELTIHHEMCHEFCPPVKRNGQWHSHHERFKRMERDYIHYRAAMAWEKTNWVQLLLPAQESPQEDPAGQELAQVNSP